MENVLAIYLIIIVCFGMCLLFQCFLGFGKIYLIVCGIANAFDITFEYFNLNKRMWLLIYCCTCFDFVGPCFAFYRGLPIIFILGFFFWYFCYKQIDIFRNSFDISFNNGDNNDENNILEISVSGTCMFIEIMWSIRETVIFHNY